MKSSRSSTGFSASLVQINQQDQSSQPNRAPQTTSYPPPALSLGEAGNTLHNIEHSTPNIEWGTISNTEPRTRDQ